MGRAGSGHVDLHYDAYYQAAQAHTFQRLVKCLILVMDSKCIIKNHN